jgi:uracil-DNA glycosylase
MRAPFAGWAGSRTPRLVIIGEAWGESEEQTGGIPFCGIAGAELTRILLETIPTNKFTTDLRFAMARSGWHQMRNAWAKEAGIGLTNVVAFRPPNNDFDSLLCSKKELPNDYPPLPSLGRGKLAFLKADYLGELDRLRTELRETRPTCIVAAGAIATWATLGRSDISNVRGTATVGSPHGVSPGIKVLPTYHPSAVLPGRGRREWRIICMADFIKAWRETSHPRVIRPERMVIINPIIEEVLRFVKGVTPYKSDPLAVDCETSGSHITCISFAHSPQFSITIPFRNKDCNRNYWATPEEEIQAWQCVNTLLECGRPLMFQNGMYDMQFLIRMGFNLRYARDDTMLLHHALYPEVQKSLGFLGSIYTNESSWKLLGRHRSTKVKGEKLDE